MDNMQIKQVVENGLQFLFSLGLDATPASFDVTVDGWVYALAEQKVVVLNRQHMERAFNRLCRECHHFPTVNRLLLKFPAQDWFVDAIATGLQRLIVLGLLRAPAAENITVVRDVWVDALWESGEMWEEQMDNHRIDESFKTLTRTCETWPAPKLILAQMPKRTPLPALPAPKLSREQVVANRRRMTENLRLLLGGGNKMLGKGGTP